MKLRMPFIISALLHACFFAAALLLSAGLLGSSSKILNEKVFLVRLTAGIDLSTRLDSAKRAGKAGSNREDIAGSGNAKSTVETKKPELAESLKIEAGDDPAINIRNKAISVVPLMSQRDPENNEDYPSPIPPLVKGGKGGFDISSGRGITSNVSYDLFSSEGRGTSEGNKGRGVLPAGIFELVRDSIENVKTYPILARKRGIEGTVYIRFRINPQGNPEDIEVSKSSGFSILDNATMDIVKKAAPLPYVDSPIEVPVVFRLN